MTRFKCVLPHTGQAFILSFSINPKTKLSAASMQEATLYPNLVQRNK